MRAALGALAAAALLATAPAAQASTHVLRPTATAGGGQWTPTPSGSSVDAALADDVVEPVAPDTSTGYITSPSPGQSAVTVGVAAPTLAAGENITGATAWVYLETGSTRSATAYLFSGSTILGMLPVRSGQSPRWYAVPSVPTPSAAQAAALYVAIAPAGTTNTAVKAYAAYVDLETDAVSPPSVDTGTPTPAPTGGTDGSGTSTGDPGPGEPHTITTGSPFAATVAPTPTIVATATGAVPVGVRCPIVQIAGCNGTVTVDLLTGRAARAKRVTAARRRKLVLRSHRRYRVAAGASARVPVRLSRRSARVLRHVRHARARITVATALANGKRALSVRTVTLRAR